MGKMTKRKFESSSDDRKMIGNHISTGTGNDSYTFFSEYFQGKHIMDLYWIMHSFLFHRIFFFLVKEHHPQCVHFRDGKKKGEPFPFNETRKFQSILCNNYMMVSAIWASYNATYIYIVMKRHTYIHIVIRDLNNNPGPMHENFLVRWWKRKKKTANDNGNGTSNQTKPYRFDSHSMGNESKVKKTSFAVINDDVRSIVLRFYRFKTVLKW